MSITSKLTTLTLTLGMVASASATDGFDPSKPVLKELKEGIYQYSQFFYNSMVVVTDEGVIITDPSGDARSAQMMKEIRKVTDKPVKKVIYSHDHFDHSRGGKIFEQQGAEFIAQENCSDLLSRDLEDKVAYPTTTYKDGMTISLGGKNVDLHYYGKNDGNCMSIVHMPEDKVLVAVDWHLPQYLVSSGRLIEQDYVATLNTIKRVRKELEFDTIINGHIPVDSPELLEESEEFAQALFDAVWKGLQEGKSVDELKESIKLPKFSHWNGYEEHLPAHVERMAYSIWHGN